MFNFLATPVEEAATSDAGCQNMGTACYGHGAGSRRPPSYLLSKTVNCLVVLIRKIPC